MSEGRQTGDFRRCTVMYLQMNRILILCALLVAQACPGEVAAEDKPLAVGFSSILSGPWAAWGSSLHNGFFLAKEQSLTALSIDFQDDRGDPKTTLNNVQKFVAEGVRVVVIGPMESLEAGAPIAARKDIPVFALGNITEDILIRHPNIIALNAYADADPRFIAVYLQSLGRIRTLAIVNGTNSVGEVMGARMMAEAKKRGLKVVGQFSLAVDSSDYRPVIAKLSHLRPDALFVHQGEQGLLTFLRQSRQGGFYGEIYTIFTIENDETTKNMGPYLEGIKYTFPAGPDNAAPDTVKFLLDYESRYHASAGGNAAIGFDALRIIETSLRACPSASLDCLMSYFKETPNFTGVAGTLTIDHNRGPIRPLGLKEIRNGKFVWVTKKIEL